MILKPKSFFPYLVYAGIFILGFFYLSITTHITDSEIWSVSNTKFFPFEASVNSYLYKVAFHTILKLPYFFDLSSWQTLLWGRATFCFVGLFLVYITYILAREVCQKQKHSFLAVFFLVTSTLFLSRGFRVRSDLLSASFFYVCLFLTFQNKDYKFKSILFFLSLSLMLLSTPKSIVFWLILVVAFLRKNKKDSVFLNGAKNSLLVVPTSFVLVASVFLILQDKFVSVIRGLYSYLVSSFVGPHSNYINATDFFHINLFIRNNLTFFILIVAGLFLAPFFLKKNREHNSLLCVAWVSTVIVVLFPNKRPFFLVTFLPIYSILVALLLIEFEKWSVSQKERKTFICAKVILFAMITVGAVKHLSLVLRENNNFDQKILVQSFDKYFKLNFAKDYYDAFGVLPRSSFVAGFIGPEQGWSNHLSIQRVINIKPDLILYTGKIAIKRREMIPFLLENYSPIGHRIWARAVLEKVPLGEVELFDGKKYHVVPQRVIQEWARRVDSKVISFTYHKGDYPRFEDIWTKELGGKKRKTFSGDLVVSAVDKIYIPVEVKELRVSRFPRAKFDTKSDFNKAFNFDVYF